MSGPVRATSLIVGTLRQTSTNDSADGSFETGSISLIFGGRRRVDPDQAVLPQVRVVAGQFTVDAEVVRVDRSEQRILRIRIAGDHHLARAILENLEEGASHVAPGELAVLYTSLGERERAFALLDEAYALHDLQLQYLHVEPDFALLRHDPRYAALLERIGLANVRQ